MQPVPPPSPDLATVSAADWAEAQRREAVIRPLAERARCSVAHAEAAAQVLGLSSRRIYMLIRAYRASGGLLTSLIPGRSQGGPGKSRLSSAVDRIIRDAIEAVSLTRQKAPVSRVVEDVRRRCWHANLPPPSGNTIRQRLRTLPVHETLTRREGAKAARAKTMPVYGQSPESPYPLAVVQMDHTPVDLIVVDEAYREPIGRPSLTLAIDVFSRCIAGMCLSLEAPSAVSVGLCLTHAVLGKEEWLAARGLRGAWPLWGKPEQLYVENAPEFHSEALRRGCEQHGIRLGFRPGGQPHYGGIVERVLGTFMPLIHELPGTTFSTVAARGDDASDTHAVMTLGELEHWMTVAIIDYYHRKPHTGLHAVPLERYREGIQARATALGEAYPRRLDQHRAFVIDFLPVVWRTLQRHGFMIDHIAYYSDALRSLLGRPQQGKFLIRRDPRDVSRVYVCDPDSRHYLEVPYRTLAHPSLTLWEHRQVVKRLRERGLDRVDEAAIFRAVEEMRQRTQEAAGTTRTARRMAERLRQAHAAGAPSPPPLTPPLAGRQGDAKPFEDIEPWTPLT